MLYYLVKFMAITAIKTFFNNISAENVENISKDTPIVFAANHPNTMMDPIIIGYTCRKNYIFLLKVHYLIIQFRVGFLNGCSLFLFTANKIIQL